MVGVVILGLQALFGKVLEWPPERLEPQPEKGSGGWRTGPVSEGGAGAAGL